MSKETIEEPVKDLAYWKANAEEDYMTTPISVLRYITELENGMYNEKDLRRAFDDGQENLDHNPIEGWYSKLTESEWFNQFKKQKS